MVAVIGNEREPLQMLRELYQEVEDRIEGIE